MACSKRCKNGGEFRHTMVMVMATVMATGRIMDMAMRKNYHGGKEF